MENAPGVCLHCGSNPKQDDGSEQPAIHFSGIDVDWGLDVYICSECADNICDLMGRVTEAEHKTLQKEYRHLAKEHASVSKRLSKLQGLFNDMKKGAKAKKEGMKHAG
jgi:hypothetical protein